MSLLNRIEALRGSLDYHLARHNVLVSNLAQADTPNFKPVDLAREGEGGTLPLAATSSGQSLDASQFGPTRFRVVTDSTMSQSADGNGVDVDREAVKIASNQIRYSMLAQLASSELATMGWAVTDGKGA